jgi:hypothetical protein
MKSLFYLLFFHSFFSFSQNVNIVWGSPNDELQSNSISVIGEKNENIFCLRKKNATLFSGEEYFLEIYNAKSLALLNSSEINLSKYSSNRVSLQDFLLLDDSLLMLYSVYNKDVDNTTLYGQWVNAKVSPTSDPVILDEFGNTSKKKEDGFRIVLSPDSGFILICHNETSQKNVNENVHYSVYDKKLKVLWTKSIELPYKDKELNSKDYRIDKRGNVYLLAEILNEKSTWFKNRPSYRYILHAIYNTGKNSKEYEINLGTKTISAIKVGLAPNGDVVVAGFYSNLGLSENEMAGTFYMRIDYESKNVLSSTFNDFESNFLIHSLGRSGNRKKELYNYLLHQLFVSNDGSCTLVAEQYYKNSICYSDFRTGIVNCNWYYYYNEIILVNVSPDGKVNWCKNIPKYQESVNDPGLYLSYSALAVGDDIWLFYNDDYRNSRGLGNNDIYSLRNLNKTALAVVKVSKGGETDKTMLFRAREKRIYPIPSSATAIGEKSMILLGTYRRKGRLGKITIN